jgi:hypothetical protein
MTIISTFSHAKLCFGLLAASSIALATSSANAASFSIPSTTVNGISSFDGTNILVSGPSFTVTNNFLSTDTISLNISGIVNLDFNHNPGYTVNAAGITTDLSEIYGIPVAKGSNYSNNGTGFDSGALLLGNSTLGYHQLLAANSANGLGSSNPPTNISLSNVSLASIFGSGLTSGTVLQFQIADTDFNNNNGAFAVSGSIDTAVPEPFTIIGTFVGGTAAVRMRKKLKSDKV